MSNLKEKVIAIDGPSGSGKSTIAKLMAQKLKLTYLDTGAMFRAIACVLKKQKIDFTKDTLTEAEQELIASILEKIDFKYAPSNKELVVIDGVDLTSLIREHEISLLTSHISKFPVIRNYLKVLQRNIARSRASILEGRDIGTVIFPNAALKFFLTADNKARAQRRYDQLVAKDKTNAEKYSVDQIEKDLILRDEQDSQREVAPLKKADDAIELDTTSMSIDEVCQKIEQSFIQKQELFA